MKCFVTGATGFIGSNLVHALNRRGWKVVALVRPQSDLRGLEGADYTPVQADLLDPASLERAMRGCDWCFHVAASYALWLPDYKPMFQTNVEGTRNVLRAAGEAGCSRIVYTSTVGCLAVAKETPQGVIPSDENDDAPFEQVARNPYKRSKWEAEAEARKLAAEGLPVVIVNPTAPIGPRDVKPTPTGEIILSFLNRGMPAYVDTGLNVAHVRDVAEGHILAAEKGRVGERYILGHREGNWTLRQALETLSRITGLPAPRARLPYPAALAFAYLSEAAAKLTGKPPRAPLAAVRMARYKMYFNPAKAIRELGLPQTPPEEAFRDAVEWFRSHGYTRR